MSASGERIAILGKVSALVQFTSSDKFHYRRPISFCVINDEILQGAAELLGSDMLSKYQAVIDMGSKVLIFDGLRFVLEDAPLVTTEMAQCLFPITKMEENVNSISLISDTENKTRNFTEEIFGIAEENAGVAMIRSGIANENAGIAKEKNFCAGITDGSTGIAEEYTPNSEVFDENAGFADGFRTTDENAGAAEDARLSRIEENENSSDFEAVAPFPGTCRDIALMQPTTCTVSSGLSRERVDNSLQAPVHNEESEKIYRSENLESVTRVNLVRNKGNKTQPFTIWGEKMSKDKVREVEMWDIFKDLLFKI